MAILGIRLIHSRPGRPEGRGKIERFFRTVRDQFLVEITTRTVADLAEMNRLFTAWIETVYHHRVHSETNATPLERFSAHGQFTPPSAAQLREAFLWSEHRLVTKTATVSLHANTYEVDAILVGRRVELVFDPFDLTTVEVRYQGRPMGDAIVHVIHRHTHPMARPEAAIAAVSTGIDYLALIEARHKTELDQHRINYGAFTAAIDSNQIPGQLTLPDPSNNND